MPARFFVDENDLALGKALARQHGDVVYPGHPDLPEVARGALDDQWLPVAGERRLVVITRDRKIRYRQAEKAAWVGHRVRGFVLTGKKSQTTSDSRAILDHHWQRIEALIADEPTGPWMRAVTDRDIRVIDLTTTR